MSGFLSRFCRSSLLVAVIAAPSISRAQTPTLIPLPFAATPKPSPSATPPTLGTDHRFTPPKVVQRLPVAYPELAHLNRAAGVVTVLFSIDEAGNVAKAVVSKSSGSAMLDAELVLDYNLLHWKFQPATFDGKPVPSTKEQEFEFRLDPAEEKAIALKRLALPIGTPDAPYPKEALPFKLHGSVTVGVHWTKLGLVNLIYLVKASGSNMLDRAALRWAYENWHIDPSTITDKNKDEAFTKTMNFQPPS